MTATPAPVRFGHVGELLKDPL
ncbi:hypothetical protein MNBD_ACTINO01-173, partial [hydrothermal vent metagenome]